MDKTTVLIVVPTVDKVYIEGGKQNHLDILKRVFRRNPLNLCKEDLKVIRTIHVVRDEYTPWHQIEVAISRFGNIIVDFEHRQLFYFFSKEAYQREVDDRHTELLVSIFGDFPIRLTTSDFDTLFTAERVDTEKDIWRWLMWILEEAGDSRVDFNYVYGDNRKGL